VGVHVTEELVAFLLVQKHLHPSVHLFPDQDIGGMGVWVDSARRGFALLCHGLPLFERQFDHGTSPFPAWVSATRVYQQQDKLHSGLRTKQVAPGCCFRSPSLLQLWGRAESQRLWTGDRTQPESMACAGESHHDGLSTSLYGVW